MIENTIPFDIKDRAIATNLAIAAISAIDASNNPDLSVEQSQTAHGAAIGLLIAVAIAVEGRPDRSSAIDPNELAARGATYAGELLDEAREQRRRMS